MTMQSATILDLADFAPRTAAPRTLRSRLLLAVLVIMAISGACGLVTGGWQPGRAALADWLGAGQSDDSAVIEVAVDQMRAVAAMSVDDPSQVIADGQDAQDRNAAIPFINAALETPSAFSTAGTPATAATALQCLTQAVYYEAAAEPLQGRRAVAQVVLNRLRHPAYPKSVCGVVYEGAQRRTGCQFSFTCDGSLLRKPAAGAWREANEVARAALAGYVERSVGTATHYHADYVLPKWAFQLGKINQIGQHIFYRFNGNWGAARAFNGHYAGLERIPTLDLDALQQRLIDGDSLIPQPDFVPGLTVSAHVTDRHSVTDVGGRLDTTKDWRLTIPDPVHASSRYRETVEIDSPVPATPAAASGQALAVAENKQAPAAQ